MKEDPTLNSPESANMTSDENKRTGNRALSLDNYVHSRQHRSFSEPDIAEEEVCKCQLVLCYRLVSAKVTFGAHGFCMLHLLVHVVKKKDLEEQNSGSDVSQDVVCQSAENRLKDLTLKKSKTLSNSDRKKKYASLKEAKKKYRKEQKQRAEKLTNSLTQSSTILLSGWLKMRGPLKNWVNRWFVLRKGVLIYYKDPKDRDWIGTIFLHGCMVTERPSKKDGFCFKIYHPYQNQIYGSKGARGETLSSSFIPIQNDYCILRAISENEGKLWIKEIMNAISILGGNLHEQEDGIETETVSQASCETFELKDEFDSKLFHIRGGDGTITPDFVGINSERDESQMTVYLRKDDPQMTAHDDDAEWAEESKGLLWSILKQVRPGMDLTRVVLPTFILEPRSFLQKLADYYFYCHLLDTAIKEKDPLRRMVEVVRWYLSGFHIRPKGMKKPYNPILGETFRCRWSHDDETYTHFVSEQVSHHPPISAFYCCNREKGFVVNGAIAPKSKFWGNSAGSILEGVGRLYLLDHNEEYTVQFPTAYCKGIFFGTLTMEMGGCVNIECVKTGLRAEIEFKLKPMIGGSPDLVSGKIKSGKETLGYLSGSWALGGEIEYSDSKKASKKGKGETLLKIDEAFVKSRLPVDFVKYEDQGQFESEKLWASVTDAIIHGDQVRATDEKKILEDAQREAAARLKAQNRKWETKLFDEKADGTFEYKYLNTDPWDESVDSSQYEVDGRILYSGQRSSELNLSQQAEAALMDGFENVEKMAKRRSIFDFEDIAELLSETQALLKKQNDMLITFNAAQEGLLGSRRQFSDVVKEYMLIGIFVFIAQVFFHYCSKAYFL